MRRWLWVAAAAIIGYGLLMLWLGHLTVNAAR